MKIIDFKSFGPSYATEGMSLTAIIHLRNRYFNEKPACLGIVFPIPHSSRKTKTWSSMMKTLNLRMLVPIYNHSTATTADTFASREAKVKTSQPS